MSNTKQFLRKLIFEIDSPSIFNSLALKTFQYQALNNPIYSEFIRLLNRDFAGINSIRRIPFLPIEFFKSNKVITGNLEAEIVFESSGTSRQAHARHYVSDKHQYIRSFSKCFKLFLGDPSQYCILALLPSYLEKGSSSLVFMVDTLIKATNDPLSGFFLNDQQRLAEKLKIVESEGKKTILLGVAFALLEFAEQFPMQLKKTIVMETGGMKGRRREITRTELHSQLRKSFGVDKIYSEYGMTELLSQAYSFGDGLFRAPPWMKILIRNPYDPFELFTEGTSGGINVIDLANINSCSFIQTDDFGRLNSDGTFEVLGRMDSAELRGCNFLLE